MVSICEDAQREQYFTQRKRPEPCSPTTLQSLNLFGLNLTEISATFMLECARSRRMINVALVYVLTYLYESISLCQ